VFSREEILASVTWSWNISDLCVHGVYCAVNSLIVRFQAIFLFLLFLLLIHILSNPFYSRPTFRDIVEMTKMFNYSSRYLDVVKCSAIKRSVKYGMPPFDLVDNMILLHLKNARKFRKMEFT